MIRVRVGLGSCACSAAALAVQPRMQCSRCTDADVGWLPDRKSQHGRHCLTGAAGLQQAAKVTARFVTIPVAEWCILCATQRHQGRGRVAKVQIKVGAEPGSEGAWRNMRCVGFRVRYRGTGAHRLGQARGHADEQGAGAAAGDHCAAGGGKVRAVRERPPRVDGGVHLQHRLDAVRRHAGQHRGGARCGACAARRPDVVMPCVDAESYAVTTSEVCTAASGGATRVKSSVYHMFTAARCCLSMFTYRSTHPACDTLCTSRSSTA